MYNIIEKYKKFSKDFYIGFSKRARIALYLAIAPLFWYTIFQFLELFNIINSDFNSAIFYFISLCFFLPGFIFIINDFINKKKEISKELLKKTIYLEHSAKIIRHDMHSGINTYIPRGLKSLLRRISDEDIERLNIKSPLKLLKDGLEHTQKIYAGVYEFTNMIKDDPVLNKQKNDIKEILTDYLKLTSYSNQVIIDKNLPTIEVNASLICIAIDNLIRNGLKYNDSYTKYVKIYSDDNFIYIEDNGRGIDKSKFKHLIEPYTRINNQAETGTGLGMNISFIILKEHGFDMTLGDKKDGTIIKIQYKK